MLIMLTMFSEAAMKLLKFIDPTTCFGLRISCVRKHTPMLTFCEHGLILLNEAWSFFDTSENIVVL
jgi:hypothetical protein